MPDGKTGSVTLSGKVLGVMQNNYTRGLHPVRVFLKIHVRGDKEEHVYNIFDPKERSIIAQKHPDLNEIIKSHERSFYKDVSEEGEFKLENVPTGWWCYIVCAQVENKAYDITMPLGDNGFHERKEISSDQLKSHRTIEHIIVPVHDVWYESTVVPGNSRDPPTDPTEFIPGVRD